MQLHCRLNEQFCAEVKRRLPDNLHLLGLKSLRRRVKVRQYGPTVRQQGV
jgi:hypothetical protein